MIIPPNMVTIGFDPFPKSSNNMPLHIDCTNIYILRILTMVTMMTMMMMMMMVVVVAAM